MQQVRAAVLGCVKWFLFVFMVTLFAWAAASGAGGGAGATVNRAATAAAAGTEDAVKRINAMTSAQRKEAFLV